jgi:hypothetical protein
MGRGRKPNASKCRPAATVPVKKEQVKKQPSLPSIEAVGLVELGIVLPELPGVDVALGVTFLNSGITDHKDWGFDPYDLNHTDCLKAAMEAWSMDDLNSRFFFTLSAIIEVFPLQTFKRCKEYHRGLNFALFQRCESHADLVCWVPPQFRRFLFPNAAVRT